MFTDKQRILIVENYFPTKSYQKTVFLFKYNVLLVSPPNKALISHLMKKFHKDIVKNLPHQWRHHILTLMKMSEIRMKFSTIS